MFLIITIKGIVSHNHCIYCFLSICLFSFFVWKLRQMLIFKLRDWKKEIFHWAAKFYRFSSQPPLHPLTCEKTDSLPVHNIFLFYNCIQCSFIFDPIVTKFDRVNLVSKISLASDFGFQSTSEIFLFFN